MLGILLIARGRVVRFAWFDRIVSLVDLVRVVRFTHNLGR